MWAYQLDAPFSFARVETERPVPGPGEQIAVVRMLAGGICGSDLPYYRGAMPPGLHPDELTDWRPGPGYPMHEIVGEVVESPDPTLRPGTRVVGWAAQLNAISEYTLARTSDIAPYDSDVDPGTAILLQPLACAIEAVDHLPRVEGAHVAVIGQGPIGVMFGHVLKSRGARHVTALDRVDRAEVAARFGVDEFVHSSSDRWSTTLSESDRPSVIVEAVGHQPTTFTDAVRAIAIDGTLMYYGIPDDPLYPVPLLQMMRKRLNLVTRMTRERGEAIVRADKYLAEHPELRESYVTHRLPVEQVKAGFDLAVVPARSRLKVVLEMG